MSQYRHSVREGRIVVLKRKLFRVWVWSFNRFDDIGTLLLRAEYVQVCARKKWLEENMPAIEKKHQERIDMIRANDNLGPIWRANWQPEQQGKEYAKADKLSQAPKVPGPKKPTPIKASPPLLEVRTPQQKE